MRHLIKRTGRVVQALFEAAWNYMGSLAAVCLFAAVLGLGIYHAVVQDVAPRYYCFAGVHNPAGAEPPQGLLPLGVDTRPSVPHVRLEYDALGLLRRMKSLDAEGRLCPLPGSRVAEQRLFYDVAGHLRKRENRDAFGALVPDAQGVAVREFEHDAAGRLTRTLFRNAAGALTLPRFPGYAECRVRYDAAGRPLSEVYLAADGKPVRNAAGEERVEYQYGADGSVTRRNLVQGVLADNADGFAVEVKRCTVSGFTQSWLDAVGKPVTHRRHGAAHLVYESQPGTGVERRCFMGVDGVPGAACPVLAEHLVSCNRHGAPVWEFYGGADGTAVNHPALGYAERVCSYSPDGKLERELYLNADGEPALVFERRHAESGGGHYVLSLHRDGGSTVRPR